MKSKMNVVLLLIATLTVQQATGSFSDFISKAKPIIQKVSDHGGKWAAGAIGAISGSIYIAKEGYEYFKQEREFTIENHTGEKIKLSCTSDNYVLETKLIPDSKSFTHKFVYFFTIPQYNCTVTYPGYIKTWIAFGENGMAISTTWNIDKDGIYLNWTPKYKWNDEL
jgi:hypothetical protein